MAKYLVFDNKAIISVDKIIAIRFDKAICIDTAGKTYTVNYTCEKDKIIKEILNALEDDSNVIKGWK